MTIQEPGGPKTPSLFDQLDGRVPEWFTDDDWRRLVRDKRARTAGLDYRDPHISAVRRELYAGLGLTMTNNTYMWFTHKRAITADLDEDEAYSRSLYNIDAPLNDAKAGIYELRALRQQYPELFEEMAERVDMKDDYDAPLMIRIKNNEDPTETELVESEVLGLKMFATMERILNLMREIGVSEQAIGILGG